MSNKIETLPKLGFKVRLIRTQHVVAVCPTFHGALLVQAALNDYGNPPASLGARYEVINMDGVVQS